MMTLNMTCKHCGTEISADDEDGLVKSVQTHASTHDGKTLSREHILHRFHVIQRHKDERS
jgi:predicted small metal-binding protein